MTTKKMDNNFTSSTAPPVVKIFVPSITMRPWCVTVTRLLIRSIYCLLRASPAEFPNFCTIWRMNSIFYLLVINFFKYTFNRFSIPFFISFKYYFFIHYLFIFLQLYIFQHFFIQCIIIIIGKKHLKNE